MKMFYSLVIFVLSTNLFMSDALGQETGDYRSNSSGSWTSNTGNHWQRWDGTTWVANPSQGYPGQSSGTASVTITGGNAISIAGSIPNAIGSLTIGDGSSTNESVTFIGTSAFSLAVTGDVILNGGNLTITNSIFPKTHSLHIGGNFTVSNTSIFTAIGTGASDDELNIILDGTGKQTIGGTIASISFQDLTINKPAGGVIQATNASIAGATAIASGTLTLTSGILTTSSSALLTLNNGSIVSGVSDNSFVDGPVKKVGATNFDFPVGKTGVGYMKISIAGITGATTEFTAQYFRGSARTKFDTVGLSRLGLQAVSGCEYWILDRAVTTSSADVTLYWNEHSSCYGPGSYLVEPLTGIRVAHFNSSLPAPAWDAHGGGSPSGNAGKGSVTWTGVSSFSPFALAALIGSQSSLPVMFNNVKAYEKNHGVQIEWSNLTERDLINYVVERSADGVGFTSISQQLPRSNQNDKESYSAFDAAPFTGANFYRIKVFEISGKVIYSKVLKINIGGKQQNFTLYPNPVKGRQVSVSISNKKGQYSLKVLNSAGQEVYTQKIIHQGGSATLPMELPATIKEGVYNMMISGDNYRESKMFIVR
jgi:hypothetical protein